MLADTAVRTSEQKRVWLVTIILAVVVVFLCLLFLMLALRLLHRGKRRQLGGSKTETSSAWATAGERVSTPDLDERPADGVMEPETEGRAEDEPYWDAEDESESEGWDGPGGDGDDDEPWR